MTQPKKWLNEVVEALTDLGGHGYYKDIYDKIWDRNVMDFTSNPHWKDAVRQTIEKYSSDSITYNKKADIFISIDGIGKGHWGLRDFEPNTTNVDVTEDDAGFPEGKKKLKQHICRERNAKVIYLAKKRYKEEYGQIICEICGFSFEQTYGNIGINFIEGHHILPVSEIPEGYRTKTEDIVLLCSNCHRMIHRRRPWLKKDELMKLISENVLTTNNT